MTVASVMNKKQNKMFETFRGCFKKNNALHECGFKIPLEQDLDQQQDIGAYLKLFCGSIKCTSVNLPGRKRMVLPKGQY